MAGEDKNYARKGQKAPPRRSALSSSQQRDKFPLLADNGEMRMYKNLPPGSVIREYKYCLIGANAPHL